MTVRDYQNAAAAGTAVHHSARRSLRDNQVRARPIGADRRRY